MSTSMKAVIIDYGYGNLFSLKNALVHIGAEVSVATSPSEIKNARKLILPGVGAFGDGIKELRKRGFEKPILEHVKNGRPLLGICLGMQFLFDWSEEFGQHKGLGLISGVVKRIRPKDKKRKVPHVGWNTLVFSGGRNNWKDTVITVNKKERYAYFVHSYAGFPKRKSDILAETEYGGSRIVAAVQRGTLCGAQFHPEKSGHDGLVLLKNFLTL